MFSYFFRAGVSVVTFALPLIIWAFVFSPLWSKAWAALGLQTFGSAAVGAAICVYMGALIYYQPGFRILGTLVGLWFAWGAAKGLAPIAAWSIETIGLSGVEGWLRALWPSIILGHVLTLAAAVALLAYAAPVVADALRAWRRSRRLGHEQSTSGLHGSSRFATPEEMATLSGPLPIGQLASEADSARVTWPLGAHLVTLAPTRSGKGVSLIIPTVLTFSGPVVVIDPKGESLMVAGRKRGDRRAVAAVDPFSICARMASLKPDVYAPPAASLNPLDFVDPATAVADVDTLIDALMPPASRHTAGAEAHFRSTTIRLLRGLISLALSEPPESRNLLTVHRWLNSAGEERDDVWARLEAAGGAARTAANMLTGVGKNELGSILSSAQNVLEWLDIPQLAAAVATSTFSLDDLLDGKADLFVCIPPERLTQSRSLLRLMTALPVAAAMRRRPAERILVLLDEAPLVGRLEPIVQAYRVAAGLNLSVWLFAQTLGDLEESYGKETARSLIGNAEATFAFGLGQSNVETCEWLSKALGDTTVISSSINTSAGRAGHATDGASRQEIKRPLMLPGDIAQMDPREMLVLTRSGVIDRPLRLWQGRYYERPEYAGLYDRNPYQG